MLFSTNVGEFLTRTRGRRRWDVTDVIAYLYLAFGTLLMFLPVLWLVLSSFKTPAALVKFPPSILPYNQEMAAVEGYDEPLPLFTVTREDGSTAQMVQIRRVGIEAQMADPANPADVISVNINDREPVEKLSLAWENYTEPLARFNFLTYLRNSVIVTVAATIITLLINSMAAFALSKFEFRGRDVILVIIISTLMIPISVVLVPVFLVITSVGWVNSLWGVIIPGAATPTGVFLLRQYMLTLPDELLASARIDGASEWRIYWQIVLPLAAPALAVLAIFSVMWRWNDFLWPLIVLSRSELFTLQVGLNAFQGELNVQWHYVLAMTVLTLLPITIVFAFLQRFITTGIATTGMK
ncbi:MAG: carbohydrate ABC transporter permease [Caldilineaceae bacterium]|nr:carbohydrate ABC transporter permease [Caldilineaceae bacterium]MCB9139440.1 carbohydrate ABC transporter permease [Caldilineaceae bacterium]